MSRFPRCESQAIRSAQLLLERQQALVSQSATFSFETTLAAKSYSQAIPDWLDRGYQVILFFLWLPSVELAIERVANRVREGGHGIPEPTIRRRYQRGLENLFELYIKLVSVAYIYEGSRLPPRLVAVSTSGTVDVIDGKLFQSIQNSRES